MYIATLTPTTENNAELTIDELRIYNAWIEVNSKYEQLEPVRLQTRLVFEFWLKSAQKWLIA